MDSATSSSLAAAVTAFMPTSLFKKKNLFNRPVVPPPLQGALNDGDGDDAERLFSRGDDVFRKRAAETAARRAKEAQRNAKATEESSDETATTHDEAASRDAKRARLSGDDDKRSVTPDNCYASKLKSPSKSDSNMNVRGTRQASPSRSSRSSRSLLKGHKNAAPPQSTQDLQNKTVIVDLESSEEEPTATDVEGDHALVLTDTLIEKPIDVIAKEGRVQFNPEPEPEPEPEIESDPELADLRRKARENARRRRLQEDAPTVDRPATPRRGESGMNELGPEPASMSKVSLSPQKVRDDPVVQYFITSKIPNTKPLITSRRFSQRLKEARLHWCYEHGFSEEFQRKIVLTFKKNRVWDSTSCKGLGFEVSNGRVIRLRDSEGPGLERIHLEAMTEEDFTQIERDKHRRIETEEDSVRPELAQEVKEEGLRLVLRAKGLAELKLRVRSVGPTHSAFFNSLTRC